MQHFYLYSTGSCHLCEQAEAMIVPLLTAHHRVEVIDIAESDALMERYAVRIPVLRCVDTREELGWPFDEAALRRFLGVG